MMKEQAPKEEFFKVRFICVNCESAEIPADIHKKGIRQCEDGCEYSGRDKKIPPSKQYDDEIHKYFATKKEW